MSRPWLVEGSAQTARLPDTAGWNAVGLSVRRRSRFVSEFQEKMSTPGLGVVGVGVGVGVSVGVLVGVGVVGVLVAVGVVVAVGVAVAAPWRRSSSNTTHLPLTRGARWSPLSLLMVKTSIVGCWALARGGAPLRVARTRHSVPIRPR